MKKHNRFHSYQHANVQKKQRKSAVRRRQYIATFIKPTDNVLDIGACTNLQLQYLTLNDPKQYYPIDINKFTPQTIVVDITREKLPFPDGFFNKVIFSMVLEHLDTPMLALQEIGRVLKEDGGAIIIVPNSENIVKNFASIINEKKYVKAERPEHCLGFGTQEICNLLKRASFNVTHFEKRSPEIVSLGLLLPEWNIFKLAASDILVVAKKF